MVIKWTFHGVLVLQAALYGWALWAYLFSKDSHVPVAYIVIHIVAAANGILAVLGCMTYFLARPHPPQALWPILAALPSIGVVACLFLLKIIHIHR
ncbi:hypothetical protein ATI61_103738 [Archangium gephyra]|uniref:Uncharacterized protein n=1 Tax=Archangium gephyra TaxID=48 RepID=A0ABX9K7L5_9BACT|nr:hypothetical protein [Archangium gephyra]REG34827.1 hypothetical protein ATI61_103738 [Archangium gephyra]